MGRFERERSSQLVAQGREEGPALAAAVAVGQVRGLVGEVLDVKRGGEMLGDRVVEISVEAVEAGIETERARIVADYLAGMTDRFALDEHRRLVNT